MIKNQSYIIITLSPFIQLYIYLFSLIVGKCQPICLQMHRDSFVSSIEIISYYWQAMLRKMITDLMRTSCKDFNFNIDFISSDIIRRNYFSDTKLWFIIRHFWFYNLRNDIRQCNIVNKFLSFRLEICQCTIVFFQRHFLFFFYCRSERFCLKEFLKICESLLCFCNDHQTVSLLIKSM